MKRICAWLLVFPLLVSAADRQVATLQVRQQNHLLREVLAEIIAPDHQVVAAETSGVVRSHRLEMGSLVMKGQLVVEIDSSEQGAILDIARKELTSAEVDLVYKQKVLKRAKVNHAQHAISDAQFDEVETMYTKARAYLALMKSRVRLQETRLQKYQIRSPFTGELVRSTPVIGQYVRPGDSVFEVVNARKRRVAVQLTPGETSGFLDGRLALLCADEMLTLISVSPVGDGKTGMTSLELDGCSEGLRPGQHVGIELVETNLAEIPRKSIQNDERGRYVHVVNGGIVVRRSLADLRQGENVIVMGTDGIRAGDLVHPIALDITGLDQ